MTTTRKNPVVITQRNMIKKPKLTDTKGHQNTHKPKEMQDKKEHGSTKQLGNNGKKWQ